MAGKVLAATQVGPKKIELREYDIPEIPPDGGLLKLEVAGICGSDWADYNMAPLAPRILGHENAGTIVRIGEEASRRWGVAEGDRVALETFFSCGFCSHCRRGDHYSCTSVGEGMVRYGATPVTVPPALWGGYSQYLYLHPYSVLRRVPDDLPSHEAALMVPLANGIQWAYFEAGAGPGKTVLIEGPGQQGLACLLAARQAGAECVIVTGLSRDQARLELATRLGADLVLDVENEDTEDRILAITGGDGVDIVIDAASGEPASVSLALRVVKKHGTVAIGGIKESPLQGFNTDLLIYKHLTIKGLGGRSFASSELSLKMIASRRYPLGELCTHQFGLLEVDRAIRTVGGDEGAGAIHVSILPWE